MGLRNELRQILVRSPGDSGLGLQLWLWGEVPEGKKREISRSSVEVETGSSHSYFSRLHALPFGKCVYVSTTCVVCVCVFSLRFYVHIKTEEAIKIFVSWTCINEELYTYKESRKNDGRNNAYNYKSKKKYDLKKNLISNKWLNEFYLLLQNLRGGKKS